MAKSIVSLDEFIAIDKFNFINDKTVLKFFNDFYREVQKPENYTEIGFLQSNEEFIILNNPKLYFYNIPNKQTVGFDYCNDILSEYGIRKNVGFLTIDLFPYMDSTLVHVNIPKNIKYICKKPYGFFMKPDSFMTYEEVFKHFKKCLPQGASILERLNA